MLEELECRLNEISYIQRLKDISQLGVTKFDPRFRHTNHTRYDHSKLTAELAYRVLLFSSGSQLAEAAYVAGWLHDTATPPYSQQGLFLGKFSEEDEIETITDDPVFGPIFENVSRENVIRFVKGPKNTKYHVGQSPALNCNGVDIDKIAYVIMDGEKLGIDVSGIENIHWFMKVSGDGNIFTNPEMLRDFLRIRSKLFDEVYRDPIVLEREVYFLEAAKKLRLKKEELMSMGETEFNGLLAQEDPVFFEKISAENPPIKLVRKFESEKEAANFTVANGKGYLVKVQPRYNPATTTRVHLPNGKLAVFRDLFPEDAKTIESRFRGYVGVYENMV